jgi:hypothetical protein
MPAPRRVNPNFSSSHHHLDVLNEYLGYLHSLIGVRGEDDKQTEDAIKVTDCFRFIKVNEVFFRYAFLNPDDKSNYKFYPKDHETKVLRDFNNVSFHLFGKENETVDEAVANIKALTQSFEEAIIFVREKNKLSEFTNKLLYNEEVGCLELRITPALIYVRDLKQPLPIFEEHFQKIFKQFHDDNTVANYRMLYKYFLDQYAKQKFFYQSLYEIEVTKQFLDEQMVNIGQVITDEEKKQLDNELLNRVVSIESLAKLISDHNALIKVISAPLDTDSMSDYKHSLNFLLTQLLDPANQRPYKRLDARIDRRNFHDPRDGVVRRREVNTVRGAPKPLGWQYTKKEATALLPPSGKMHFWQVKGKLPIVLIFDVNDCWLKNGKYIFSHNSSTNLRWWLAPNSSNFVRATTLDAIRRSQNADYAKGITPSHPEILAGLTSNLRGLGVLDENNTSSRSLKDGLNLIRVKYLIKHTLKVDLPLIVLGSKHQAWVYSPIEQLEDIFSALDCPENSYNRQLVNEIPHLEAVKMKLWNSITHEIFMTISTSRIINIILKMPLEAIKDFFIDTTMLELIKSKASKEEKNKLLVYAFDQNSSFLIKLTLDMGADIVSSKAALTKAIARLSETAVIDELANSGENLNQLLGVVINSNNLVFLKHLMAKPCRFDTTELLLVLDKFKQQDETPEILAIIADVENRLRINFISELKEYQVQRQNELNASLVNKWFFKQYNSCWGSLFGYSGVDKLNVCSRLITHFEDKKVTPMSHYEFSALKQGRLGEIIKGYSKVFALKDITLASRDFKGSLDTSLINGNLVVEGLRGGSKLG